MGKDVRTGKLARGIAPEARPNNTPEARPNNTPEARPNNTPEARPNNTPEARPDSAPEARRGSGAGGPDGEPSARHVYGPRTLAALLPPITRPAFRSRSPAATALMTDWPALVGPDIAASTNPKRFAGGTLFLSASGPTALELQHQTPQLMARINGGLGRQIVERIRFVQEDTVVLEDAASPRTPDPEPMPVDGLPEGDLHDALARLQGRIAARIRP